MDGFEANEGVIIVAATNRPDVLDPALLRPGRFDRQVIVPVPDVKGRQKILEIYAKKTKMEDDVDMEIVARGTPGFTGADLENLVNEAALMAARSGAKKIDKLMIDKAKDKIMMGAERRSMIITDAEKEVTAYHEAGHALVARLLPDTDPIHKVTIIPRGQALGVTMQLPKDERYTHSKKFLENTLCILFGGRVAEKIIFDEITTGAGNDIERASDMARKMVCAWGMSEELGPLTFGKKEEQIFLGREISQHRDFSEDTARKIDEEVHNIILTANKTVIRLLTENKDILKRMAEELLEKETIVLDDIERILAEMRPGQYEPIAQKPEPKPTKKAAAETASPVEDVEAPEAEAEAEVEAEAGAEETEAAVLTEEETVQKGEQNKE
jgi:cell division protease FtsH